MSPADFVPITGPLCQISGGAPPGLNGSPYACAAHLPLRASGRAIPPKAPMRFGPDWIDEQAVASAPEGPARGTRAAAAANTAVAQAHVRPDSESFTAHPSQDTPAPGGGGEL